MVFSSLRSPFGSPGVPIFLHMKLSESSVKFSRFCPSVVSLYTFLGLSLSMFHSLFTYPFFSNVPSRGYMVLGPKYTPKVLRIFVIIW